MIVSFVILHYENIDETVECINSILNLKSDFVKIVVVDNGSKKNKLYFIEEKYNYISNVHFIHSEQNLGFAKGNNLGFEYAKYNLKSDIIILSNNDIIYKQNNFIEKLIEEFNEKKFDVAGPKIIRKFDGINQNPEIKVFNTVRDVKRRIRNLRILYILGFFGLDNYFLKIFNRNFVYTNSNTSDIEDYQLHGACLIFANNYIKKFDGLYNKTFMYGEESILKYLCDVNSLKMCYLPKLEILHLEGASVSSTFGKGRNNRLFFYKNNIKSCLELVKLMKNEGGDN